MPNTSSQLLWNRRFFRSTRNFQCRKKRHCKNRIRCNKMNVATANWNRNGACAYKRWWIGLHTLPRFLLRFCCVLDIYCIDSIAVCLRFPNKMPIYCAVAEFHAMRSGNRPLNNECINKTVWQNNYTVEISEIYVWQLAICVR